MCGIYDDLKEEKIDIDQDVKRRYKRITSEGDSHYRYSVLINPILAVNIRRGYLANPTQADWERYSNLQSSGQ